MRTHLLYTLLFLLGVSACSPKETAFLLLHTNDSHGSIFPYDSLGGMARRAALVRSLRDSFPGDVLLLDAGDLNTGQVVSNHFKARPDILAYNYMGYDAATFGNHEFDNGIEDLTGRLAQLKGTEVVSANIDVSQFELADYVKPCTVIERGGFRIGIIGLEADLSSNVSATISSRIPQLDDVEVTNRWAEYLRDTEKCDLVILLSHIGYEEDQKLVPQTRNLDLVIGGHSHTFVDEMIYVRDLDGRKVPVVTDGCFGVEMGEVKIY